MHLFGNQPRTLRIITFAIGALLWCLLSFSVQADNIEDNEAPGHGALPAGTQVMRDVPYGKDTLLCMNVYLPRHATGSPVITLVLGGAWRLGDKGAKAVFEIRDGAAMRQAVAGYLCTPLLLPPEKKGDS